MDDLALMLPTAAEPPNGDYEVIDRDYSGRQLRASYPNGYGASVIKNEYSYGGREGLYELAVFHGDSLCYRSSVTSDVIGWLSPEQVVEHLHQIARLVPNELCIHRMSGIYEEVDS